MKHSAAVAHFRQLCCLGLDAHTVMPTLMQSLHDLVGSDSNAFFWAAEHGDICNVYFEQSIPPNVAALYFGELMNNPGRSDSTVQIRGLLPNRELVGNSARLFPKTFYCSDMYNLIWRELKRQWVLWAKVSDAQGSPHGVALYRSRGDSPFKTPDEKVLAQLIPYLAHAVNARGDVAARLADSGESALVIFDEQRRIRYQSDEARRLLLLAAYPRIAPGTVDWRSDATLPAALGRLCDNLERILVAQSAPPPVFQLENVWGKFVLRAYRVQEGQGIGGALSAILIERQVPLKLKLLDAMRALPLSAKQKEVGLLLAEGLSHGAIAARLNVRPSTVVDHVRKLYNKLGAQDRKDLLRKLTGNAAVDNRAGARSLC